MSHDDARVHTVLSVALALLLGACASPAQQIRDEASVYGFDAIELAGKGFNHSAYYKGVPGTPWLHVYIEGDGRPWLSRHRISPDPTPRKPIALRLMARDRQSRLYLGRPCYFGHNRDNNCTPFDWTHGRYSTTTVATMAAALRQFLQQNDQRHLVLIGYSGGGTLAWLLANEFPERTRAVVTIAANLDIEAWTEAHAYSPLAHSMNPALMPPLDAPIQQFHFIGADDRNITLQQLTRFRRRHTAATFIQVDNFDHQCCWVERWPTLLRQIHARVHRVSRDSKQQ